MAIVVTPTQASNTKADDVPNGTYKAVLSGIRQFQNVYGERLGFEFTVNGGDHDGSKVMRSCAPNLTAKSKLAELLRGLYGRNLTEHELTSGLDIENLVGTECKVLVVQEKGKGGKVYSNVVQIFK